MSCALWYVRIDRLSVEWGPMSDDGDDVYEAIIIMSLRILNTYLPREQRRIVNPSRYFVYTDSREVLDYKCNADQASYEYPGGKSHRRMERGGGWAGGGWFSLMDEVTDPRSSRLQARAEVMSLPACRDSERYSVTYSLFPYSVVSRLTIHALLPRRERVVRLEGGSLLASGNSNTVDPSHHYFRTSRT
ncbi:uncharacterized protein RAG0_15756 [Rhynchosporium agropyri]|uniref:Uncharacterized protein n=1 Tax=Rhynchosporium agropyri TaxID=914238 RepID=A0A1E1LMG0_9HELO|nr:uncharacterized protein RAG0_15756 [Rhynchosporium agropyri]